MYECRAVYIVPDYELGWASYGVCCSQFGKTSMREIKIINFYKVLIMLSSGGWVCVCDLGNTQEISFLGNLPSIIV